MRLLLWDCDDRSYAFDIYVSIDRKNWQLVVRKDELCRSWQFMQFDSRPVVYFQDKSETLIINYCRASKYSLCDYLEALQYNEVCDRFCNDFFSKNIFMIHLMTFVIKIVMIFIWLLKFLFFDLAHIRLLVRTIPPTKFFTRFISSLPPNPNPFVEGKVLDLSQILFFLYFSLNQLILISVKNLKKSNSILTKFPSYGGNGAYRAR